MNTISADLPAADTTAVPRGSALLPQGSQAGARPLPVDRAFTLIGSRPGARWRLVSASVSRSHAALILNGDMLYVRDLGSRTKVFVNGRVYREVELDSGDVLQIGAFVFKVQHPPAGLLAIGADPIVPAALYVDAPAPQSIPISRRTLLIGRRPNCEVVLTSQAVSNVHALIFELNGAHYIRDLLSRTGTHVNEVAVKKQQRLNLGDQVRIGQTIFRYDRANKVAAPNKPALPAAQAVDKDVEDIDLATEEPQPAVPADRLSSSGSFADVQFEANEAVMAAAESDQEAKAAVPKPEPLPVTLSIDPLVATFGQSHVTLAARVESGTGAVGEGAVTFTLLQGTRSLGSSQPVSIAEGAASVKLPVRELSPGAYLVQATYDPQEAAPQYQRAAGGNTLTVRKAAATLRLGGLSAIYSGAPHAVKVTTEPAGLQGVSVTYGGATTVPVNAGRYPVVAQLENPNYRATPVSAMLVIARAPLALTAQDVVREQNKDNPPLIGSLTGLLEGDRITAVFSTRANRSSPAGSYEITAKLSDLDGRLKNYALSYTHGTLTIIPAPREEVDEQLPNAELSPFDLLGQDESPNPVDALAYAGSAQWSVGCDQASFIGGLPVSIHAARQQAVPVPPEPAPFHVERRTTVIRGAAAPPRAAAQASAPVRRTGFFAWLKRLLGLSRGA